MTDLTHMSSNEAYIEFVKLVYGCIYATLALISEANFQQATAMMDFTNALDGAEA